MNVYRIVVDRWPTADGRPWPRFIEGPGRGGYGVDVPHWQDEEVAWFARLADPNTSEVQDVIDEEFSAGEDQASEIVGWILPDPTRRHYLNGSAARRWVRRARLLGADARVVTSEPITWKDDTP